MKYFLLVALCYLCFACNNPTKTALNTVQTPQIERDGQSDNLRAIHVLNILAEPRLPFTIGFTIREDNDPNELLGRPNQYFEKVTFAAKNIEDEAGLLKKENFNCSIEIFYNTEDAQRRKTYIDAIGKNVPIFVEYSLVYKNALIRFHKSLPPSEVNKYLNLFKNL